LSFYDFINIGSTLHRCGIRKRHGHSVRSVVNNVHQVDQKIVPVHKIDVQKLPVKDSQVFLVAFGGYK
jgi:hypothetical protein